MARSLLAGLPPVGVGGTGEVAPPAGKGGSGIAGGGDGSDTTDDVLRICDVIELVRFGASVSSIRALQSC